MEEYEADLERELQAITAIKLVNSVALEGKLTDGDLNAIRVRANLKGQYVEKKSRRHPHVACSLERPTQLHAARELRARLMKDFKEEIEAAEAAEESAAGPSASKATAGVFAKMAAASLAHRSLEVAVDATAAEASRLRAVVQEMSSSCAAAEKKEAAARAALRDFEPRLPNHKRQKRGFAAEAGARSDDASSVITVGEGENEQPDEVDEKWGGWDLSTFRRKEIQTQRGRERELSNSVAPRLPSEFARGQRDGPLDHWRHGLVGALQFWANGSSGDAAKLVAGLVKRLGLKVHVIYVILETHAQMHYTHTSPAREHTRVPDAH